MHISDGVLSVSSAGLGILATGWAGAAVGVGLGLRRLDDERIPTVGVMSAVFFAASALQVPLGPIAVHLVLNGLMGLVLGAAAFPAILCALLLQWLFFGEGGITTLGINTVNMALPAVICYHVFRGVRSPRAALAWWSGFGAGFVSIILSAALTGLCILAVGRNLQGLSAFVWITDAALALGEGLITAAAVAFLHQVRPEVFQPTPAAP